jgi:hypothetical protein
MRGGDQIAAPSIVHLAGAMGKPVWALLPFAPDFRWLLGAALRFAIRRCDCFANRLPAIGHPFSVRSRVR